MSVSFKYDHGDGRDRDSLDRWASLGEVADYLGIDKRTLKRIRETDPDFPKGSNFCPGKKKPHPRFKLRDVAEWADGRR